MSKPKTTLSPIKNEKIRNITFNKRKLALLKKATELSILCNVKVFLMFTDMHHNLFKFVYPSDENVMEFCASLKNVFEYTNHHYPNFQIKNRKERSDKKKNKLALALKFKEPSQIKEEHQQDSKLENQSPI